MNNPEGKINSLITSSKKEMRILNRMKVSVDENGNVIDGQKDSVNIAYTNGTNQHLFC